MKTGPMRWLLVVLVFAANSWAHRLDEYLQATRISVDTDRIVLSLDLTPGVAVADSLLPMIDKDRDGKISKQEGLAYGQRMLKDLRLSLDDRILVLHLADVFYPTLSELRTGLGVVRMKITAPVAQLAAGRHALSLTNTHLPAISVYLVNALVPKDPAIEITKQTRDEFQKNYCLEFRVSSSPPSRR